MQTLREEINERLKAIDLDSVPEYCLPSKEPDDTEKIAGPVSDDTKRLFILMRQYGKERNGAASMARAQIAERLGLEISADDISSAHVRTFCDQGHQPDFDQMMVRIDLLSKKHDLIRDALWLSIDQEFPETTKWSERTIRRNWQVVEDATDGPMSMLLGQLGTPISLDQLRSMFGGPPRA